MKLAPICRSLVALLATATASSLDHPRHLRQSASGHRRLATQEVPQLNSANSAADLEQMVMDMMKKNTPDIVPMAQQLKNIVTKDMMPRVLDNRARTQQQLNASLNTSILACRNSLSTDQQALQQSATGLSALAEEHRKCRTLQDEAAKRITDCQQTINALRLVRDTSCKAVQDLVAAQAQERAHCDLRSAENYGNYTVRLAAYFSQQNAEWLRRSRLCDEATANMTRQETTCTARTREAADQKARCDSAQDKLDNEACDIESRSDRLCTRNVECHNRAVLSYNAQVDLARAQEKSLRVEWEGLLRLRCMSEVFDLPDADKKSEGMNKCRNQDHTAEVTRTIALIYPPVPDPLPCSPLSARTLVVYGTLPAGAPAKPCTSQCCGPKAPFMIRSKINTKMCLDVAGYPGGRGGAIGLADCEDGDTKSDQRWELTPQGQLKNVVTGWCIDVAGDPATHNEAKMQLWDCEDFNRPKGSDQFWELTPAGQFVNKLSKKCMDVQGNPGSHRNAPVQLFDCEAPSSTSDQFWNVQSV